MKELNLTQILKDCPKGTKLYSPLFGEVEFDGIDTTKNFPIFVRKDMGHSIQTFMSDGKFFNHEDGECVLFPSRDQRDWSKFKVPKPDLPIDTPVMVKAGNGWNFRYYAGNGAVYVDGSKSADGRDRFFWKYIIPFNKFNPDNIEGCVKNFNYGTEQD